MMPSLCLIQITKFGDFLRVDPDSKVTDDSHIRVGIKWHGDVKHRCSNIEIVEVSRTHYRVVCKQCGTLVIVPSHFNTYLSFACWVADMIEGKKPEDQWGLPAEGEALSGPSERFFQRMGQP